MLAERRKLFAMRISSGVLALALMVCAGAAAASAACAGSVGPSGTRAGSHRLQDGLLCDRPAGAQGGRRQWQRHGQVLCRVLHGAYLRRQRRRAQPIIPRRSCCSASSPTRTPTSIRMTTIASPFVAKAFIALAGYVRGGLKDIGVAPNPRRAANYLHHAAIFFGDKEAQFELAKLYLSGEGGNDDVRRGLHYLSALSEQSYPAAQALLAELLWKGRFVKSDERRALALITMAAENAPASRPHLDRRDLPQHLLRDDAWHAPGGHRAHGAVAQDVRAAGCRARRSRRPRRQGIAAGASMLQWRGGCHPQGRYDGCGATGERRRPQHSPRSCRVVRCRLGFRAAAGAPPTTGSTK